MYPINPSTSCSGNEMERRRPQVLHVIRMKWMQQIPVLHVVEMKWMQKIQVLHVIEMK